MRQITVKYQGECKRCGNLLGVGQVAMYEKSMGIFCVGCEPKDVDEIRAFRQARADIKAQKYDEWAEKREIKASTTLNHIQEHYRGDFAFNTQPGHIPERARVIRQEDKAFESLNTAEGMRRKAKNLRHVRVAGDAERKRQMLREQLDQVITKGSKVYDFAFGSGEVVQVCKKSYRVKFASGNIYARDKSFVKPL